MTLLLFDGSSEDGAISVRAGWCAPEVPALPASATPTRFADIGPALRGLQPIIASDALAHPALAPERELLASAGTKSLLTVPIQIDGLLRGVAVAATVRERREWSEGDVQFLQSAARHLAAGQKQAELIEELEAGAGEALGPPRPRVGSPAGDDRRGRHPDGSRRPEGDARLPRGLRRSPLARRQRGRRGPRLRGRLGRKGTRAVRVAATVRRATAGPEGARGPRSRVRAGARHF